MCSTLGLWVLILTVLGFMIGLAVDRYFQLHGLETITAWARQRTWRQWLLVGAGLLIPIGLAMHLWCGE